MTNPIDANAGGAHVYIAHHSVYRSRRLLGNAAPWFVKS